MLLLHNLVLHLLVTVGDRYVDRKMSPFYGVLDTRLTKLLQLNLVNDVTDPARFKVGTQKEEQNVHSLAQKYLKFVTVMHQDKIPSTPSQLRL